MLAVLAYPLLAHAAAVLGHGWLAFTAAGLLLLLLLWPALRRGHPAAWLALPAALALLAALAGAGMTLLPLLAPPVLLNAAAAWLFARSLRRGRTPLIERIARALQGPDAALSPEVLAYTRRVTAGWALLLSTLALLNLVLALLASPGGVLDAMGLASPVTVPRSTWSLFANLLNYLVVVLWFVAEYLWRRHRFPLHTRAEGGFTGFGARMMRLGPAFWRQG